MLTAAAASLQHQIGTEHAINTLRGVLRRLCLAAERAAREEEMARNIGLMRGASQNQSD